MQFQPSPLGPDQRPEKEPRAWRRILLVGSAFAVWATTMPWVRVRFERLFGSQVGPPGWHSKAGFTCFCTCLLVAVMAIAESDSDSERRATRPGSAILASLAALSVAFEWGSGPGSSRGVSAVWTPWFYVLTASMPLVVWACIRRWAALPPTRLA